MSVTEHAIADLEARLDDFRPEVRRESLEALCALADRGEIRTGPEREIANLHCHSFFSYNGCGYSPSRLAWEGKKLGLKFMGLVDFDVLDGVDEFLAACDFTGLRGSAGMETRAFIPEFADRDINSPGEPGVAYIMGIGFASGAVPASAAGTLADIRRRAGERNRGILERINASLAPLTVDYERDVLPATPSGNPTERHLVAKILEKSLSALDDPAHFWSAKLDLPLDAVRREMAAPEAFQNAIRKKLMKRGGVGYVPPAAGTFPRVDEFCRLVRDCRALPCAAWLDGTSPGEQAMPELLALLIEKGAAAVNIIPDRNWNIADPREKAVKLDHLYRMVRLADGLDLPVQVGTEMNSPGQKLVDDFDAPELAPLREEFLRGASFIYGHGRLERSWGLGYQSPWARRHLPDRKSRNTFYTAAGRLLRPGPGETAGPRTIDADLEPAEVLRRLATTGAKE